MSNSIFCIVSAIGNQYGAFSYQERFEQLIESIESINNYAPDSDIVIYDASEDPLPEEDIKKLRYMVNDIILLHDNKYIQFLKYKSKDPSPNKYEKKTFGEIEATIMFLDFLKSFPKKYDRVFKLTGRYKLNENFNINEHLISKNKCVFVKKECWFGKEVFPIRLWSFDYNMLNQIKNLFEEIQKYTLYTVIETQNLQIIEYTLAQHIEKNNVSYHIVNTIGVFGYGGLSGSLKNE